MKNNIAEIIKNMSQNERQMFLKKIKESGEKYQIYPLSSEQKRMWFTYKIDVCNPYYNVVFALRLTQEKEYKEIEKVLYNIISHNAILHSIILDVDGFLFQAVQKDYKLNIMYIPESSCTDIFLQEKMMDMKKIPFDLEEEIPIKFAVVGNKTVICLVHHIAIDGWSMGLFKQQFEAEILGQTEYVISEPYSSYVIWQNKQDYSREKLYWKGQLEDMSPNNTLPTDYKYNATDFAGQQIILDLNNLESQEIKRIAKKYRVSVFNIFISLFSILLYYCSKKNKIVIGTPVLNRRDKKFYNTIGFFANTIPLIFNISSNEDVSCYIKNNSHIIAKALQNQSLPYDKIIKCLKYNINEKEQPLIQAMFNMESNALFNHNKSQYTELILPNDVNNIQFDLICSVIEEKQRYTISLAYKKSLFKNETISILKRTFYMIIKNVVSINNQTIDNLIDNTLYKALEKLNSYENKISFIIDQELHKNQVDSITIHMHNRYFIFYRSYDMGLNNKIRGIFSKIVNDKCAIIHLRNFPYDSGGKIDYIYLERIGLVLYKKIKSEGKEDISVTILINDKERDRINCSNMMKTIDNYPIAIDSAKVADISKDKSILAGKSVEEIPYKTLRDLLLELKNGNNEHKIYTIQYGGNIDSITYKDLRLKAIQFACYLQTNGIHKGRNIVLQIKNLKNFIIAFWGCMLNGNIVIPLGIPTRYTFKDTAVQKLFSVYNLLENPVLIGGKNEIVQITNLDDSNIIKQLICVEDIKYISSNVTLQPLAEDDIAIILFTSGSTGIPKGVQLSHRNILKRSQGVSERYKFGADEISLNWMPFDHVGGLVMHHILDVYNKATQIQVETQEILRNPLNWLILIDRFKVTRTWAPNFAYGLIINEIENLINIELDLSSCKFILNGGEAIHYETCKKFLDILKEKGLPDNVMHPAWGMTETASGILFSDNFGKIIYKNSVSVGTPIGGTELKIVNENNEIIPVGEIGKLMVRGETINKGYYKNPEENVQCFVDQWFATGDLAAIIDNEVVITGRSKDLLIVNGMNISCLEIEKSIEEMDGIISGGVACCVAKNRKDNTDKAVIVYAKDGIADEKINYMNKNINDKLITEFSITECEFVAIENQYIPRTSIGKIDKKLLLKWYDNGKIAATSLNSKNYIIDGYTFTTLEKEILYKESKMMAPLVIASESTKELLHGIDNIEVVTFETWKQNDTNSEANGKIKEIVILWESFIEDESILSFITEILQRYNNINKIVFAAREASQTVYLVEGYFASLRVENKEVTCQILLGDFPVILEKIFVEDNSPYVEYKNGQRYVKVLKSAPITSDVNLSEFKNKRIVILGGLGGIGYLLSEFLLRHCDSDLILIGRKKYCDVIDKMSSLRTLGSVHYYSLDVCDYRSLENVLNEVSSQGRLDCIINLIGEENMKSYWENSEKLYIRNLNNELIKKNLYKRIQVCQNIDTFLKSQRAIKVYIITSIAGLLGGLGTGIYSAVSNWMYNRKIDDSQNEYHVIATTKWENIGMSEGEDPSMLKAIKAEGMDVLDANNGIMSLVLAMLQKHTKVMIGINKLNYNITKFVKVEEDFKSLYILEEKKKSNNEETELKMQKIWEEFLHKDYIPIDQKFFDAGGDSLKSIRLISKINEAFGSNLDIVDLFKYPTIELISQKIKLEDKEKLLKSDINVIEV